MVARWKIYCSAVLIFIGGGLISASALYFSGWRPRRAALPRHPRAVESPAEKNARFAAHLQKRYGIPAEKMPAIMTAFEKFFKQMDILHGEFTGKMRALHQNLADELQQLMPREAFSTWKKDQEKRFHRRPGKHGAMPPPGGHHPAHHSAPLPGKAQSPANKEVK